MGSTAINSIILLLYKCVLRFSERHCAARVDFLHSRFISRVQEIFCLCHVSRKVNL